LNAASALASELVNSVDFVKLHFVSVDFVELHFVSVDFVELASSVPRSSPARIFNPVIEYAAGGLELQLISTAIYSRILLFFY